MLRLHSNSFGLIQMPSLMADTMVPMGKEDMVKFLDTEEPDETIPLTEEKEEKSEKTEKSEKKAKEEEEIEIEEDDDEETDKTKDDEEDEDELEEFDEDNNPDEEKLELVTPVRRKEILKKYPKLFDDFPYLEKAYYREQQFTEVFPTLDDARKAQTDSETLSQFESDLMDGNSEVLFTAVQKQDPKAFAKLVDNYLPTLAKVDNAAYLNVVGNIIKYTIQSMVVKGRARKNEALESAAAILNQFVFDSDTYEPPQPLSARQSVNKEVDEETRKFREEKENFNKQKFDTARTEVNTRINNSIKATIEVNIDPKGSMTAYNKKNASRDAIEQVEAALMSDSRLRQISDKLWERARESNFSKESVDRIRAAYLAKAKTLLPAVIKKARIEALRGMGKRVKDDTEETDTRKTRSSNNDKPESRRVTGKITNAKDIPRKMTTLEFLNSED